jgi:hypothetical protein
MKKKIQDIIIGAQLGGYTSEQAAQKVLDLFAVSRRSEQLFCDCEIKGSSFQLVTGEICCCKCEKERAK